MIWDLHGWVQRDLPATDRKEMEKARRPIFQQELEELRSKLCPVLAMNYMSSDFRVDCSSHFPFRARTLNQSCLCYFFNKILVEL